MSAIEVTSLVESLSPDSPCGEDLEYDPAYGELERAAQGKPEQQFGDTIVPAEEPDLRQVKELALNLFPRTRDLRVATYLARGATHCDGLIGLRDSLEVVHGLLAGLWDDVHPRLDPDDDNDPTLRINTLASLCDPESMLKVVREAPLVSSRALGRFSLRHLKLADGSLVAAAEESVPDMAGIDAAFLDCDLDELTATAAAATRSLELMDLIESTVSDRVGAGYGVDLDPLRQVVKEAERVLTERLARRGVAEPESEPEPATAAVPGDAGVPAAPAATGEVNSREDVIRLIDKICRYYDTHEPSSPIPLLLQRAKRLARKSFLDIVRDLAPDGVSQIETIGGVSSEESEL
jgi:type VI secretion system protein ImpA